MKRVAVAVLCLVGLATVGWVVATRETWGPHVATDPAYRSGRKSVCKTPASVLQALPARSQDGGQKPVARGFARTVVHTFDASGLTGGAIDVCSEYGFVNVTGIPGNEGRVEVTVSSPFPAGEIAITDTQIMSEFGVIDGKLQVSVAQRTQGVTSFRSLVERASRPAAVNVTVQVPRSGPYDLTLTANHQRIAVRELDVRGVLEGYGSPGADIDAGLDGDLNVRLSGVSYQSRFAEVDNVQGGTTVKLRPRRSGTIDVAVDQSALHLEVVGDAVGLDVATNGSQGNEIQIGATESSSADATTARARGTGFSQSAVQLSVRASNANGSVSVRRSTR
jgi:hypothetical protein